MKKKDSPAIALRFVTLDRKVASLAVAFWNEHSLASLGRNENLIKTFQTHIVDEHSSR